MSLAALTSVLAVVVDAPPLVRLVPALLLVLFAPGYVFQSFVFAGGELPTLERLVISVAGSIVLTILVGLILAAMAIRLEPASWAVALALLTFVGAPIASLRRRRRPTVARGVERPSMRRRDAVPLVLAGLATIAIIAGTRTIAADQEPPGPPQLWLLPSEGGFGAYLGMSAGGLGGSYTIRLTSAGELLQEFNISLVAHEGWEQDVVFDANDRTQPIVGRLYDDADDELRFVVLNPIGI